jgi:hypothetical protein
MTTEDLRSVVVSEIGKRARGRRIRTGVFFRGNPSLVEAIASMGHRTVVMGDRFPQLFALRQLIRDDGFTPLTIVETRSGELPIASRGLDVLVLSRGLPNGVDPKETLARFRRILAPGGLLIWPHPIADGVRGVVGKLLVPYRRGMISSSKSHRLCRWLMEAGYREIGLRRPKGTGPVPWAVTTGTVGQTSIG